VSTWACAQAEGMPSEPPPPGGQARVESSLFPCDPYGLMVRESLPVHSERQCSRPPVQCPCLHGGPEVPLMGPQGVIASNFVL